MPEAFPCPAIFDDVCDHPDTLNCDTCARMQHNSESVVKCFYANQPPCDRPDNVDCQTCERSPWNAGGGNIPMCTVRESTCRHDPPHDCENCKVWQPGDICWVATYQESIPLATPIVIDEVGETTVAAHWYAPYDTQLDPFAVDRESFSIKELFPTMERCLSYLEQQLESYARQNAGYLLVHLHSNGLETDLADKLGHIIKPINSDE